MMSPDGIEADLHLLYAGREVAHPVGERALERAERLYHRLCVLLALLSEEPLDRGDEQELLEEERERNRGTDGCGDHLDVHGIRGAGGRGTVRCVIL